MTNTPPILSPDGSVYLPITQASEMLGVSPPTLRRWREKGKPYLPHYVIDDKIYYLENDLKNFIEARTYEVAAPHAKRTPFAALTDSQFSRIIAAIESKPRGATYLANVRKKYQINPEKPLREFLNWVFNAIADGAWPDTNPHSLFSAARLEDLNLWSVIIGAVHDPIEFPFIYSHLALFSIAPLGQPATHGHLAIKVTALAPDNTKIAHNIGISLRSALIYANTINAQNFAREEIEKPMAKRGRPTKEGSRRERAKAARIIRETTFPYPK